MVVEVHPARALPAPVGAEIAARLARCFETDFGGRSFFTQPYHLRRVKRRYGKLVGHMALLLRSVLLGDRRMSIAALAEVATDPDHRSQGIAAGLIQAAIAAACNTPAPFLLLVGEARLHAATGFRAGQNPPAHLVTKGTRVGHVVKRNRTCLMVLPLCDEPWPEVGAGVLL